MRMHPGPDTGSLRVVKDHTACVTVIRSQTADAVSKVHAEDAPGSLDGASRAMDGRRRGDSH
jgi:hypothetical protein